MSDKPKVMEPVFTETVNRLSEVEAKLWPNKEKLKKERCCEDCGADISKYKPERKLCGWCRFNPQNYERGRR